MWSLKHTTDMDAILGVWGHICPQGNFQVLDPFCGEFGGFWRCLSYLDPFHVYLDPFMLLRPFSCLLRAPGLVALATHRHLKINFKPVTVVTGGVMACFY